MTRRRLVVLWSILALNVSYTRAHALEGSSSADDGRPRYTMPALELPEWKTTPENRELLRSIFAKIQEAQKTSQDPRFAQTMVGLVRSIGVQDTGKLKGFESQLDALLRAKDTDAANRVFEGFIRDKGDADLVHAAAYQYRTSPSDDSLPVRPEYEFQVTSPPEPGARPPETVPGFTQGELFEQAWGVAFDTFREYSLGRKREVFSSRRRAGIDKMGRLSLAAFTEARSIRHTMAQPPAVSFERYTGLQDMDRKLGALRDAVLRESGVPLQARSDEDQDRQFEAIRKKAPHLALYLANRGLHQYFVLGAVNDGLVPPDTEFALWELGLKDEKTSKAVYTRHQALDGKVFSGFRRDYDDGSFRFEAVQGREIAVVWTDGDQLAESRMSYDGKGALRRSSRTVLDRKTRKKVSEMLFDTAKKLRSMTRYDADGELLASESMDLGSGAVTVTDYKAGVRRITQKDGKTEIRALGAKPWEAVFGTIGKDGSFKTERIIQGDSVIRRLAAHVVKVTDRDGSLKSYQVSLDELFGGLKGKARERHSWELARELVRVLGLDDKGQRRSRPLHNWLFDTFTGGQLDQLKGASLLVEPNGEFSLVYDYKDGSRRIEKAKWGLSTSYKGSKRQLALVVLRPVHVRRDPKTGELKGSFDPRKWKEYLSEGGYQSWRSTYGTQEAGWFRSAKATETLYLQRYSWEGDMDSGSWKRTGTEQKDHIEKEIRDEKGQVVPTSTFGILGHVINHDVPVVSGVLEFGGKVGKTAYTSVVGDLQLAVGYAFDSDEYKFEGWASLAQSPLNQLIHGKEHMTRGVLSEVPGHRIVLEMKARENRVAAMREMGYTEANTDREAWDREVGKEYTTKEFAGALSAFGATTYGSRLIEMGAEEEGWTKAGLIAAGSAMTLGEGVGQLVFNPVAIAAAVLSGGTSAAAQVASTALGTVLMTSWAVNGVDNFGRMVVNFQDGKETDAWKNFAQFTTDAFFLGVMAGQMIHARSARAAQQRMRTQQVELAKQAYRARRSAAAESAKTKTAAAEGTGSGTQGRGARLTEGVKKYLEARKAAKHETALAKEGKGIVKSDKPLRKMRGLWEEAHITLQELRAARSKARAAKAEAAKSPKDAGLHKEAVRTQKAADTLMKDFQKAKGRYRSAQAEYAELRGIKTADAHQRVLNEAAKDGAAILQAEAAAADPEQYQKGLLEHAESHPQPKWYARALAKVNPLIWFRKGKAPSRTTSMSKAESTYRMKRQTRLTAKANVVPRGYVYRGNEQPSQPVPADLSMELYDRTDEMGPDDAPPRRETPEKKDDGPSFVPTSAEKPFRKAEPPEKRKKPPKPVPREETVIPDAEAGTAVATGTKSEPSSGGGKKDQPKGGGGSGGGGGGVGSPGTADGGGAGGGGGGPQGGDAADKRKTLDRNFDGKPAAKADLIPVAQRGIPPVQEVKAESMPLPGMPRDPHIQASAPKRKPPSAFTPFHESSKAAKTQESAPLKFLSASASPGIQDPMWKPRPPEEIVLKRKASAPETPERRLEPVKTASKPADDGGMEEIPLHKLRPAGNIASNMPEDEDESDEGADRRMALALALQLSALGAGIFLYKYSSLPYVLGIKK